MNDEAHSDLLDAEFRHILYMIKPLVGKIDDHYRLEKCRVWLERLSVVHRSERLERNKYLLALANQIHDGVLEVPFTATPPKGLLPPLKKLQTMMGGKETPRGCGCPRPKETQAWPFVTQKCPDSAESVKRTPPKENTLLQKKKPARCTPKVPPLPKKLNKGGNTAQDAWLKEDSWYDISDTPGDTDAEEETKKLSLQHKAEGLKLQEHYMKKYEEQSKQTLKDSPFQGVGCTHKPKPPFKSICEDKAKRKCVEAKNQPVVRQCNKECVKKKQELHTVESTIKDNQLMVEDQQVAQDLDKGPRVTEQEIEDLLEVKHALIDTHCLTEDRKKTVDALNAKVARLEQENAELRGQLDSQEKEFVQVDQTKSKEMSDFKDKFTLLRQKEVDYLKQYHKKEIAALEKTHNSQVAELEARIAVLKKEYEDKIKVLVNSSFDAAKQKDEEIQELQIQLKMKANQIANEGSGEQIISLKRCISKLDKVLHKNEKDYIKKIERLKQELEVKDMTNQMQLQTQRADLIVRNAATKQEELKCALNSLEGKYKKMMDCLQTRAVHTKKQDEKLIEELRTLLDRNNIPYAI
ncbi:centrosomal protein of 112 kDa-like isoform X2 [Zophobas morio]|uniref:centrosomal protein of 112 kDa-like isoform X2 n=1 Tax=Zophobas morio TaxID=2755281 RepID=UPI00308379B2